MPNQNPSPQHQQAAALQAIADESKRQADALERIRDALRVIVAFYTGANGGA